MNRWNNGKYQIRLSQNHCKKSFNAKQILPRFNPVTVCKIKVTYHFE